VKSYSVTIQIKTIDKRFLEVLFIVLCKAVLTYQNYRGWIESLCVTL